MSRLHTPVSPILSALHAAKAEGYTLYPLWREVLADCDTPVSAYRKLASHQPYTFLLESVEGGERLARYSFIGLMPERVLVVRGNEAEMRVLRDDITIENATMPCNDPLAIIEQELARDRVAPVPPPSIPGSSLPRFTGGAVGYLGYETVARYEPIPLPERDPLHLPEVVMMFMDTILIFDHVAHRARILTHVRLDDDVEVALERAEMRLEKIENTLEGPIPPMKHPRASRPTDAQLTTTMTEPQYEEAVLKAKEAILAGDAFQIVLSRSSSRPIVSDAFTVYRALRALNPSPYLYYLDCGDFMIAGASPEMLVRVEDGEVALHPIAGTRPRGMTPGTDAAFEAELRYDPKEQAEHVMLVDLGRNDVGRIAVPGSVRVAQMMEIERYSHVMHLVSHITGALRKNLTPFDAVRAAFPAGTLTGAPKVRAMQIIAELEGERRGVYGGGIGYFGRNGNVDMAIAIRTCVIKDNIATVQAGAGIVADSVPAMEFQETERKAEALWRAIDTAENISKPARKLVGTPPAQRVSRSRATHE